MSPRRHYTLDDPEPHGTTEYVQYLMHDLPDWPRRLYGRRMIRRMASGCERCNAVDARRARIRRLHTAYRRKH